MASGAVDFDPSTAKPTAFDPQTAKPISHTVPGSNGIFGVSEAAQRGILASMLGGLGDIESAVRAPFALATSHIPGLEKYAPDVARPYLATTQDFLKSLPGRSIGEEHPVAQNIGTFVPLGGAELAPAKSAISAVPKIARTASEVVAREIPSISRILPGATAREEAKLATVAKPTGNFDPMGQAILQSTVGGEYTRLYDARAALLSKAAHIADEGKRTAAFRKIYNDQKFKTLRAFEQSPLGKKLTQTTGPYSEVIKADPSKIPHFVFDTPESVRQFKTLMGGNQEKVEFYARQYAAESLNNIVQKAKNPEEVNVLKTQGGNVAKALRDWRNSPQQEWLNEVPETKKAVDDFISGFEDMAVAQRRFKIGITALTGLGLGAGGALGVSRFIPFRSLYGGVE